MKPPKSGDEVICHLAVTLYSQEHNTSDTKQLAEAISYQRSCITLVLPRLLSVAKSKNPSNRSNKHDIYKKTLILRIKLWCVTGPACSLFRKDGLLLFQVFRLTNLRWEMINNSVNLKEPYLDDYITTNHTKPTEYS